MVDNSHSKEQQQSSELNKDVIDADNNVVQKGGDGKIVYNDFGDAAVTTSAATNGAMTVHQEVESLGTDLVLSDGKDNNKDVLVDDDRDTHKGSGGKIKNIAVGAATAALNVARAAKQKTEYFGSDVLSDVKDARNFVLPQTNRDSNTIPYLS